MERLQTDSTEWDEPKPTLMCRRFSPLALTDLEVYQMGMHRTLQAGPLTLSVWSSEPTEEFNYMYWGRCARKIAQLRPVLRSVLILGLGGGTLAWLLCQRTKPDRIVGVELDAEVIDLGRRYFYLDAVPGLEIVQADAAEWLRTQVKEQASSTNPPRFDLIASDLFFQGVTPPACDTAEFFAHASTLLAPDGLLSCNKVIPLSGRIDRAMEYVRTRIRPSFENVIFQANAQVDQESNVVLYVWGKPEPKA